MFATWADKRLAASLLLLMMMVLLMAAASGCVRRRMTIRSNPPGAQVQIDNYPDPIGVTPTSADFIYYGTREIRLIKDGYETLTVEQPVRTPWYQVPPLDFITENLWPFEIRDERSFNYTLAPQPVVPAQKLLQRAEELRRGTQAQYLQQGQPVPQESPVPPPSPERLPPPAYQPPQTLPPGGRDVDAVPQVRRLPHPGRY